MPPGTKRSACVRHHTLTSWRVVRPWTSSAQPFASRIHQSATAGSDAASQPQASWSSSTSRAAWTPITTTIPTAATKPATRSTGMYGASHARSAARRLRVRDGAAVGVVATASAVRALDRDRRALRGA